ncbi:hypothetical protein CVS40_11149 [Lucilia cuprina]|nr:hypothetical protein CVS40_11149 [Lucilia cuprina]
MLRKEKQPLDAIKIANILPTASPRQLKRIVKSIPTPSSDTTFSEEEAIALMLQLGLGRDNYITLRKALSEKGVDVLPSYDKINEKKKSIIPSPIEITDRNCCYWTRRSTGKYCFKDCYLQLIFPLRIRKNADSDSPSTSFDDIWKYSTPGSKAFCRPKIFEYIKESKTTTKINVYNLYGSRNYKTEPITIEIENYRVKHVIIKLEHVITRNNHLHGTKKLHIKLDDKNQNYSIKLCQAQRSIKGGRSRHNMNMRNTFLEHYIYDMRIKSTKVLTSAIMSMYKADNKRERQQKKDKVLVLINYFGIYPWKEMTPTVVNKDIMYGNVMHRTKE